MISRINELQAGVKRILLVIAIIISIILPLIYFIMTDYMSYFSRPWSVIPLKDFLIFILIFITLVVVIFISFWAVVRIILWIIDGFKKAE